MVSGVHGIVLLRNATEMVPSGKMPGHSKPRLTRMDVEMIQDTRTAMQTSQEEETRQCVMCQRNEERMSDVTDASPKYPEEQSSLVPGL